jgi:RNA polymerase sigma-70 factor, ECF subfamily
MTSSDSSLRSNDPLRLLLAACAQADKSALADLYRLTSPKLFSLLLRILKRQDWAEETLQEGFINIWRHAGEYDPQKGSPFTWMASIVRHRALDLLRRTKRETILGSERDEGIQGPVDENPSPLENLVHSREASALKRCLEELQEEQRRSIVSAYYQGLTHEELADRMKKPLGTVKTWIRRGLERLRKCLES